MEKNLSSQALDTFLVSRADNRQEYSNFDAKSFRKHENFRILENSMTLKMEKNEKLHSKACYLELCKALVAFFFHLLKDFLKDLNFSPVLFLPRLLSSNKI